MRAFLRTALAVAAVAFLGAILGGAEAREAGAEPVRAGAHVAVTPDSSIAGPIQLPDTMYATVGEELNIYLPNIAREAGPGWTDLYLYDVSANWRTRSFRQFDRVWRITPVAADVGVRRLTLKVYLLGSLVSSKTISLDIRPARLATPGTRKLLAIGDSTTAGGQWEAELVNRAARAGLTIITVGTKDVAVPDAGLDGRGNGAVTRSISNEAISGWTVGLFSGDPKSPFFKPVSLTAAAAGSAIATLSNTDELAPGAYVTLTGGTPETLEVRSIVGERVSFVTPVRHAGHTGAGYFALGAYLRRSGITLGPGDYVAIHLGINDVSWPTSDVACRAVIEEAFSKLRAMIANMRAQVPGLRIVLLLDIPPASHQDAWGFDYPGGQAGGSRARYARNIGLWREATLESFDNGAYPGVYVAQFGSGLDTDNFFPTTPAAPNYYAVRKENLQSSGVHPSAPGYYQLGGGLAPFFLAQER